MSSTSLTWFEGKKHLALPFMFLRSIKAAAQQLSSEVGPQASIRFTTPNYVCKAQSTRATASTASYCNIVLPQSFLHIGQDLTCFLARTSQSFRLPPSSPLTIRLLLWPPPPPTPPPDPGTSNRRTILRGPSCASFKLHDCSVWGRRVCPCLYWHDTSACM